jgi:hypothetical protein
VKATFVKGVILGSVVSVVSLLSSAAVAGTGVGGVFNLGKTNTVNATTTLTGATAGKQLQVTNTSAGTGATGIGITVASGKPPLSVNSSTRVNNLNASFLRGKTPSAFLAANGTAVNSTNLGGLPASGFVHGTGTVSQSGLITVDAGIEVVLGTVPNLGALAGDCHTSGATYARVRLVTDNALPAFLFGNSNGSASWGSGGHSMDITDDTTVQFASAQIASGTHTATITAIAWDDPFGSPEVCQFSAQITSSG